MLKEFLKLRIEHLPIWLIRRERLLGARDSKFKLKIEVDDITYFNAARYFRSQLLHLEILF